MASRIPKKYRELANNGGLTKAKMEACRLRIAEELMDRDEWDKFGVAKFKKNLRENKSNKKEKI